MKNEKIIMIAIAVYAAAMVMIFNILGAHAQNTAPIKNANAVSEEKFHKDVIHVDVADFLLKSTDARMMDAGRTKSYGIRRSGGMRAWNISHFKK